MAVEYTDPNLVESIRETETPAYGRTVSGYGGKIPVGYMIRYAGRWHRVYVMLYSNSGTAYIVVNGNNLLLDIDTEYKLTRQG